MFHAIVAQAVQQSTRVPLSQQSTEYLVFRAAFFLLLHAGFVLMLIGWLRRWPTSPFLRWRPWTSMTDDEVRPYYIVMYIFFVPASLVAAILPILELVQRW